MRKVIKTFLCLFVLFSCPIFLPLSSAKYVIEDVITAVNINIDKSKPKVNFFDFYSSLVGESDSGKKLYLIKGHIKITEKNIEKENLSQNSLKFFADNTVASPDFQSFCIVSKNNYEIIYEFSFFIDIKNGLLTIEIPSGVVIDKSGLINDKDTISINPMT